MNRLNDAGVQCLGEGEEGCQLLVGVGEGPEVDDLATVRVGYADCVALWEGTAPPVREDRVGRHSLYV
jgi:hypothetical protein